MVPNATGWRERPGAGLAATALSTGAAAYFWILSSNAVPFNNAEDLTAFCLFMLVGGFISLLSENLIQARQRLEGSLRSLEGTVLLT
jgi:hypothetical protein